MSGIRLEIHPSFIVVIALGAWQGWLQHGGQVGVIYGVLAMMILFAGVLAHEFGHAVQAQSMGLAVRRIKLLPIGGTAEIASSPGQPWQDLAVAAAGPLANAALALISGIVVYTIDPYIFRGSLWQVHPLAVPGFFGLLRFFLLVNLMLFVLNLLPVLPLDGGRIMRAVIAHKTTYERATHITAWAGRLTAGICMVVGLLLGLEVGLVPALLTESVAIAMLLGIQMEDDRVSRRRLLLSMTAGDLTAELSQPVEPWDQLADIEYSHIPQAVVVDQRVVGLLTPQAHHTAAEEATVAHIMESDFPTISPTDTLWAALCDMEEYHLAALPVLSPDGSLLYMITLNHIEHPHRYRKGA